MYTFGWYKDPQLGFKGRYLFK